jgi:hypothetical protein
MAGNARVRVMRFDSRRLGKLCSMSEDHQDLLLCITRGLAGRGLAGAVERVAEMDLRVRKRAPKSL